MSQHQISETIDLGILERVIVNELRPLTQFTFSWSSPINVPPLFVVFTPDLSVSEEATLNKILGYFSGATNFNVLPNWATWTDTEAETNITNSIFGGQSATTIKANIASSLTDITTANVNQINTRLAVIRTLLGNAVDAIIVIRNILAAMGKAIVYLRNLVVKLR